MFNAFEDVHENLTSNNRKEQSKLSVNLCGAVANSVGHVSRVGIVRFEDPMKEDKRPVEHSFRGTTNMIDAAFNHRLNISESGQGIKEHSKL